MEDVIKSTALNYFIDYGVKEMYFTFEVFDYDLQELMADRVMYEYGNIESLYEEPNKSRLKNIIKEIKGIISEEVDFDTATDDVYYGEQGLIIVALNEDKTELVCRRKSEKEFRESVMSDTEYEITPEEASMLKKYVDEMTLDSWDWNGNVEIKYKPDIIISDKDFSIIENISDKLSTYAMSFSHENVEGEVMEDNTGLNTLEDSDKNILIKEVDGRYYIALQISDVYRNFMDAETGEYVY